MLYIVISIYFRAGNAPSFHNWVILLEGRGQHFNHCSWDCFLVLKHDFGVENLKKKKIHQKMCWTQAS